MIRRPSISEIKKYGRRVLDDEKGQFIVRNPIAPPDPPVGVLFAADFSAGASPDFGFDGIWNTADLAWWTFTSIPGGGPGGIDAVQIECIDGGVHADNQFGFGWSIANVIGVPPFGSIRYVRMWIKFVTPIDWARQPTGNAWGDKLVIWGSGGPANMRMMWNIRDWEAVAPHDTPSFVCEKNIDGLDTRILIEGLPTDVWVKAQWKIQFATSAIAVDSQSFMYIDGDNSSESTPTEQSGLYSHNCEAMADNLILGGFGDTAFTPSSIKWQFSKFEVADQFDDNWGN